MLDLLLGRQARVPTAFLHDALVERLMARLDLIKLDPKTIWVVEWPFETLTKALRLGFPHADLQTISPTAPWPEEPQDLIISASALYWMDYDAFFKKVRHTLTSNGLLFFVTLGPDTLKELRATLGNETTLAFPDMHDLGDALLRCQYRDPVMNREDLTIQYPEPAWLLKDLKAWGQTVPMGHQLGLKTPRQHVKALQNYPSENDDAGQYPATFEVVYGHAFQGEPVQKTGDIPLTVSIQR